MTAGTADRTRNIGAAKLQRRFVRAPASATTTAAYDLSLNFGKRVAWADLLEYSAVVVLGEAGTGKTTELEAMAATVCADGGVGFFLAVESLVERGVKTSLASRDPPRFQQWLSSDSAEATFFLDSVDESQLKGHTLSAALDRLCDELDAALGRVRLVVSSRPSDWRSSNEGLLEALAARLARPKSESQTFSVMQLDVLRESEVRALCAYLQTPDPDGFIAAVTSANAWSFVERPLDVQWLAGYWAKRRKLGTLTELIHSNIAERLKEKPSRPSSLTPARARECAATLALAAVLSRPAAFRVPGEVDPAATDAFDPADALPSLSSAELRDLLGRGIFDEATYGRVQIHHRNVQEFLAAGRLEQMVKDGLRRRDLESLFFHTISGRVVVPEHLRGVLIWLAGRDADLRRRVVSVAAQHLMDEGDPSAIPAVERAVVLRAYADQFRDRKHVFHGFDSVGLKRFASPELAPAIRKLLSDPGEADHVRDLMLRLVAEGGLSELADVALRIAVGADTDDALRMQAVRTTLKTGTESQRRALVKHLPPSALVHAEVVASLLRSMFPEALSVRTAVDMLLHINTGRMVVTTLDSLLPELPAKLTKRTRAEFLRLLLPAMRGPVSTRGRAQMDPERSWLGELLAELVALVVEDGTRLPEILGEALELLLERHDDPDFIRSHRTKSAIDQHPTLRRYIFWHKVAKVAAKDGKYPRRFYQLMTGDAFGLTSDDVPWLRDEIEQVRPGRERAFLFDCFLQVVFRARLTDEERTALIEAVVAQSDAANRCEDLAVRMERLRNPPHYEHHSLLGLQFQDRWRTYLKQRRDEKNIAALRTSVDSIRAGKNPQVLRHLHYKFLERDSQEGPERLSFSAMRRSYGDDVADAARSGLSAYWRRLKVPSFTDYAAGQTPWSAVLANLGVTHDIDDGLKLSTLTAAQVKKLMGLAFWSLRLPDWLGPLAATNAGRLKQVLVPLLRLDFSMQLPKKDLYRGRALGDVADSSSIEVLAAAAPETWRLLRVRDPAHGPLLVECLSIIERSGVVSISARRKLAKTRALARTRDRSRFVTWWTEWFTLEPLPALARLAAQLKSARNPARREVAQMVFASIWARCDPSARGRRPPHRLDRETLIELIPLVYGHIRERDDPAREGAYFIGEREHCEDLRRNLLPWLSAFEGPETISALEALAAHPALRGDAEWIRHLANLRAVDDAAERSLDVADAISFISSGVLMPRTSAELYRVALDRIDDFEHWLRNDEFSLLPKYDEGAVRQREEHLQGLLGHYLKTHRRDQYIPVLERQDTNKKRRDICLINNRCKPVTLELKVAERWATEELEIGLRDQLVALYMRDDEANYGVYVVCSSGLRKSGWLLPSGVRTHEFRVLMEHLREFAAKIVATTPRVRGLEVVGIDFHQVARPKKGAQGP